MECGHRLVIKTQPLGQPAQVVGLLDSIQFDSNKRRGVNISRHRRRVDGLDQGRNVERVFDLGSEEFRVRGAVHDTRPLVVVEVAVGAGRGYHGAHEQPGVGLGFAIATYRTTIQGPDHEAVVGQGLLLAPAAAEFGFTVARPDALGDQIV